MLDAVVTDVRAYVEAKLPAACAARGLEAPAAYFLGLPVDTMLQQYPACIVDVDSGSIGGQQATEIAHQVYVCMVDRDQDVEAGNLRLCGYVDAIVEALDGKRFGSVVSCRAEGHDSSNLFSVGSSRAVRMRWVRFRVTTIG